MNDPNSPYVQDPFGKVESLMRALSRSDSPTRRRTQVECLRSLAGELKREADRLEGILTLDLEREEAERIRRRFPDTF